MIAALYHRTTVLDDAESSWQALAQLDRYRELKNWKLGREYVDRTKRPGEARPAFEDLVEAVDGGEVDVVIVERIGRLFTSSSQVMARPSRWGAVGIVSLAESLDTTTAEGARRWQSFVALLEGIDRRQQSESISAGILLSRQASGRSELAEWGAGRAKVPVSWLEIRTLYEEGRGGRYLSQRQIVAEIRRLGGRCSAGILSRVLREMREVDFLDEEKRRQLAERTGGPKRGGRPRTRLTYDRTEIIALRSRGYGAARIAKLARSLPKRATKWYARQVIAEVESAGRSETPGAGNSIRRAGEGGGGLRNPEPPDGAPLEDGRGIS